MYKWSPKSLVRLVYNKSSKKNLSNLTKKVKKGLVAGLNGIF